MHKTERKIILSLETGLNGGSVAILKDGKAIDCSVGSGAVSKSEDLLLLIDELLKKNGVSKKEIGLVAVSDSPGSLTGLRIGLALAKGLADSFSAGIYKTSIFEAMAAPAVSEGRVMSAVYSARSGILYKEFDLLDGQLSSRGEVEKKIEPEDFLTELKAAAAQKGSIVLTAELGALLNGLFQIENIAELAPRIKIAEGALAEILGLSAGVRRLL